MVVDGMGNRVFLTGLALGPAVAMLLLPAPALSFPLTMALGGAGSAYALLSSLRARTADATTARTGAPLLRAIVLRDPPEDLPDLVQMRRTVQQALSRQVGISPTVPPSAEQAVAEALGHLLRAWQCPGPDALSRDEVVELFLLRRLLLAPAEEAGALAQLFQRPDAVLDIRDNISLLSARRAVFDRHVAAYEATLALWQQTAARMAHPTALVMGLQALRAPDVDLWHRVVLEHDRSDPEHRAAALWCVRQRACDKATVAAYLAFLGTDGSLQAAATSGDQVFLDAILDVIEAWNGGAYQTQELALEPPDRILSAGTQFSQALTEVAQITGGARMPDPCGVFVEYDGRRPRYRKNWCLQSGRLTAAPEFADYVELEPFAVL